MLPIVPALAAIILGMALSYWFRSSSLHAHLLLIWLLAVPTMFVAITLLIMLVSFKVFGIDLLD
jgi:hypothetical protein